MDLLVSIIVLLALFILGMLLKLSEISLPLAEGDELDNLIQEKNRSARRVSKLIKNTSSYVSSVRTAISTVEFISAALAVMFFSGYIVKPLVAIKFPYFLAQAVALISISFIYITLTVILIAIVARHLALKSPMKTALVISGFAMIMSKLFLPLSAFISFCSKCILNLMSINPEKQDGMTATEAAIKNLVDTGTEHGMIDDEEKEFIENVFAFDDLDVDEIATHRKDITLLWTNETDAEWEKTVIQSHHSYFPICEEKIDNIVGVLSAKEFLRLKNRTRENVMKRAVKKPYYIPEKMKANIALKSMKQRRTYFAVVIDEYGGMSGILTVTDLLSCIVGEILEEGDIPKVSEIEPLDSKTWRILGQAEIEDVEDALDLTLDGDFDTFAGYVLTMVDFIPDDGTVVTVENEVMSVKITEIKDHRILKTVVKLKDIKEAESD